MFFLTRRPTRTAQPSDAAQIALPAGLTHIASYLPRGYTDVSGAAMTRGSAASFTTNGAGPALKQTAVNTAIYREIAGLPVSQNKYIAVWSGEILGAPTSTTPKLLGISNSATSQSSDYLSIERGSTGDDYLQVISKTGATVVSRQFNVGLTALYGKRITLVGVYSPLEDVARVHVFADNAVATYSSAVTGANSPSVLGTERFVVGVDIIENPTRSANANCNLASIFAGDCTAEYELSIAANPWQIFAPQTLSLFIPEVSGAGPVTHATSGTLSADSATAAGSAARTRQHAVAGSAVAGSAVTDGATSRTRAHATSGAFAAGDASVAGSSARTLIHATSGSLSSGDAITSGAAARPGPVTHATSGALTAGAASTGGVSARERLHASTGALSAVAAAVAGAAALPGSVTHETSGALAADSASTDGESTQHRIHVTSGALVSSSAGTVGAALRTSAPIVHDASGALSAGSAALAGQCVHGVLVDGPGQFALSVSRTTNFDCKIQRTTVFSLGVR